LGTSKREELHALERSRIQGKLSSIAVEQGEVIGAAVASHAPEHDHSVLIAHRQRTEEQRIGNSEHRRREADPKRKREHDADSPATGVAQRAPGESEVLSQIHQSVPRIATDNVQKCTLRGDQSAVGLQ
jgi:hypothetical protein